MISSGLQCVGNLARSHSLIIRVVRMAASIQGSNFCRQLPQALPKALLLELEIELSAGALGGIRTTDLQIRSQRVRCFLSLLRIPLITSACARLASIPLARL